MLTKYSLIIRRCHGLALTAHEFFVIVHNFIVLAGNLSWRRACCGWLCRFWLCFYLFLIFLSLLTHSPIVSPLILLQSLILNLESLYYKYNLGEKLQGIGNLFSWRFLFEILLITLRWQHIFHCSATNFINSKKKPFVCPKLRTYYSITFCSVNSVISMFTLRISVFQQKKNKFSDKPQTDKDVEVHVKLKMCNRHTRWVVKSPGHAFALPI